jgi:hypothetical protein
LATADNPDINGIAFDWSSIEIAANGRVYKAFTSIDYKNALEPGEKRGNQSTWLGRTRGQLKPEASFEMHKVEYQSLVEDLGPGYMEKAFDVLVMYADFGQPTIVDTILGFRIKEDQDSPKEGNEPPKVKVTGHIYMVLRNGIAPVTDVSV